jgi:carbamoyl-phosphate synthase large subunit
MPKRKDIKKILIIGSGPIVIGQACEFDYSGTQAVKVLRQEGYNVVLVNSNPATIMTDPKLADKTYLEPLNVDILKKIIQKEQPDCILPTLGGQTALNLAVQVYETGILERYGIELIGAKIDAIKKAEDRKLFKKTMQEIGLDLPRSGFAYNIDEAQKVADEVGFPLIIRPSFTLGGTGSKIVFTKEEFFDAARGALQSSMISEILIEEYLAGWKEYELEVMRDKNDNCVIVCPIENFDPMGVHTGDSITVAPAQTLTDKEYQLMRDAAFKCIRAIGVETGGSNIQFAVNPKTGRMVVIEMNPRVSRSSALASKATGFPIAKIAALLSVGYTLDEIKNDITKKTPACFEPTIDYVVVKIPRFAFEKFQPVFDAENKDDSYQILGSQMKSIGEVMAIGRTFKESLQKAIRGLEIGRYGLGGDGLGQEKIVEKFKNSKGDKKLEEEKKWYLEQVKYKLRYPNCDRIFNIKYALQLGMSVDEIAEISHIDRWFIAQINELVLLEKEIVSYNKNVRKKEMVNIIKKAKQYGYSDYQLGYLFNKTEKEMISFRQKNNLLPNYKVVDTCAAEFEAYTPYFYSTYDGDKPFLSDEINTNLKHFGKKVIVLGSGPNRIGQGIEFDYCCVHAIMAIREEGYGAIMVNCNPETVSTDYDTADKLYFEPITVEDVYNIYLKESKISDGKLLGVILQFGGQTPLNIALKLKSLGVKVLGTQPESIALAEDRELFAKVLKRLKIPYPPHGKAESVKEAFEVVKKIGYPIILRPSYVLGGRAMEIVYDDNMLLEYLTKSFSAQVDKNVRNLVLIDKFLENAKEIDVDAISDGKDVFVAGIMEHIESAGIHSGDSACVLPPVTLSKQQIEIIKSYATILAKELKVCGLINLQLAIKDGIIYVLEVNPRASRTVPYVSKSINLPIAKLATKIVLGKKVKDLIDEKFLSIEDKLKYYTVKEVVLPFSKFSNVDAVLSPEMRSTGEVMGIDKNFPLAYAKSQFAAGSPIVLQGKILVSFNKNSRLKGKEIVKELVNLGYEIIATPGTAKFLNENGIPSAVVKKINEGRPNVIDIITNKEVVMVINTPKGRGKSFSDGFYIRRSAILNNIPIITTLEAAECIVNSIKELKNNLKNSSEEIFEVCSLQQWYSKIPRN